ncbi:M15 family metallopeptidase [Actinocorallia longicatena]|uniref:Peptidase M15C domain-containing protein n=1 Tax=Actinocorallia longicatena TaxID=111803 RepID=A0ABP6Q980_9ACTN
MPLKDLRVITMPYWGFDKQTHAGGRLVVNAKVATGIVNTFKQIYAKRYPIRKMVLVDEYKGSDFDSIEADNTSAFNCRAATGSSNWSRHAYGMAVDINPCENPYVDTAGTIYHKRCARYYTNRSGKLPGVITGGDEVVRAFRTMNWKWGGYWAGTKDYQHFSASR